MPFLYADGQCANSAMKLPQALIARWKWLALSTGQADPACCGPIWNLAFHWAIQPSMPIYYRAGQQSMLIFCVIDIPQHGPVLVPLENGWCFGNPMLGLESINLLRLAVEEWKEAYYPHFPVVEISGIQESSHFARMLYFTFKDEFDFFRVGSSTQCAASLVGGVDGWLGRRSANHRAKLKKSVRKCVQAGIVFERHTPDTPGMAAELFTRMLAVEKKSWKGIGKCGMAEGDARNLYGKLIELQALSQSALVIMARKDDQDVGYIYGGACGPFYRGQQFSFDNDLRQFSLGNVMQYETVKWLCELDFLRYDMGPVTGPRMEYKKHWTDVENTIRTWRMRKKSHFQI